MGSSHMFAIYSLFVDLKVHEGLYLVYLTLHMREGVKRHDIHIKSKSYKLELLGELIV